jgi:hypothetical protein
MPSIILKFSNRTFFVIAETIRHSISVQLDGEEQILRVGEQVTLRAYGGEHIERLVCEVKGGVVYVCTPEEYRLSIAQRRAPLAVGFHLAAIIEC